MNMVLCFIVAGATEITSNTATASLLMPIMFELAITVGIHPLYLMMSACIACSFAFMLPVATPPNAIVFSTGTVRIPDMALTGIVLNILAVGVLTLAINTWGTAIFKLDTFPEIFLNSTKASTCPGTAAISVIDTTVSLLNSTLPSTAP
ncbi:solute carrier family 13 member 2-like [Mizuhopecten yessoensis]|uniref:solute carrier family 13 member 2-like n=1 Tax=Mizuhopecten yessoensis TaxID=6573 RepID=UPI000B457536|nr:solute carrier family 13 member 2-like [Mizuhopecten yessoensis]